VFYRREITRYGREGDTAKASEARASFNKINVWLSAYDDSAVSACLQRNGG